MSEITGFEELVDLVKLYPDSAQRLSQNDNLIGKVSKMGIKKILSGE